MLRNATRLTSRGLLLIVTVLIASCAATNPPVPVAVVCPPFPELPAHLDREAPTQYLLSEEPLKNSGKNAR